MKRHAFAEKLKRVQEQKKQQEVLEAKLYRTDTIVDRATEKTQFPVLITKRVDKETGLETYKIYLDKQKGVEEANYLGFVELSTNAENTSGNFQLDKTNSSPDLPKALLIKRLDTTKSSQQAYKGIGSILFKIATERSKEEGFEGRVKIEAQHNSAGFYYKLGMRSPLSNINEKIEAELNSAKKEGREPKLEGWGGYMYSKKNG